MARLPNYDPEEHMIRPEDFAMTRREMLRKAGMGNGRRVAGHAAPRDARWIDRLTPPTWCGRRLPPAPTTQLTNPLAPKLPPLPAKAKHVIHIFAGGGPSHVDTLDPKPALDEVRGPDAARPRTAWRSPRRSSSTRWASRARGQRVFPKLGECVDDMCVIRSMWTDVPATSRRRGSCTPARCRFPSRRSARGSSTAWAPRTRTCRLHRAGRQGRVPPGVVPARRLPGRRTSTTRTKHAARPGAAEHPATSSPASDDQRRQLDLARKLNAMHSEKLQKDEQLEARIESFELAFRMQTEATDAFDITKEPPRRASMYGNTRDRARSCSSPAGWSSAACGSCRSSPAAGTTTRTSRANLRKKAGEIDQPVGGAAQGPQAARAARRHAGHLGRRVRPHRHARPQRQRHTGPRSQPAASPRGWPAAASRAASPTARPTSSATRAAENRVHVHDLHATILHCSASTTRS